MDKKKIIEHFVGPYWTSSLSISKGNFSISGLIPQGLESNYSQVLEAIDSVLPFFYDWLISKLSCLSSKKLVPMYHSIEYWRRKALERISFLKGKQQNFFLKDTKIPTILFIKQSQNKAIHIQWLPKLEYNWIHSSIIYYLCYEIPF